MKGRMLSILKRLCALCLSLVVLSAVVFCIARLTPGDPLFSYYGDRTEKMSPQEREWAMDKLGLNDPLHVQYLRWVENALHGEFGLSYKYKQPVFDVIAERAGNTLLLGGLGFMLTFALALLLGVLCAWFEDRLADRLLCRIGALSSCIPEFWLSLILILIFSVTLRWLPSSGAYSVGGDGGVWDLIRHLILPLSVVILGHLWYYAYMIRNRLLEEMRSDYVLLAKSKGLKKSGVVFRHCLRNIMPGYFSLMAISIPHILGGTYIVETVFSYPGLGALSYESARYKDYNLLMVLCMLSGALVMLCSMLSQILNERIDPRMRASEILHTEEADAS